MPTSLSGKVAIITGASRGIGAGIAQAFGAAGASVVVNYKANKVEADAVVAMVERTGGAAIAIGADASNPASAQSVVDAAIAAYGRLDILVNNAGIAVFGPIETVSEDDYRRQFDLNVLGAILMTQAALKVLTEGASIINIGSIASETGPPDGAIYAASKGAVDGLTTALANELGPRKIRVNSLNPGIIATDRLTKTGFTSSERGARMVARTPLGRFGTTDDVGDVAVFLASDSSRWITGSHIVVAGGYR